MNIKKFLFVLLLVLSLTVMTSCSKEKDFEKAWDAFVDAVNEKDIEAVANLIYENKNQKTAFLTKYRDGETPLDYFANVSQIETVSFEIDVFCDLSTDNKVNAYASADIVAKVTSSEGTVEKNIKLYGTIEKANWYFCNQEVLLEGETWGNNPSDSWSSKVYFTTEDGLVYKIEGTGDKKYAVIYDYNHKDKEVEIPETIDGYPVTHIAHAAFYVKSEFVNITLASSKLRKLTLPNGLTTIKEYAFYQAKKLKEVYIPSSVTTIEANAFASCRGLEKIVLDVNDSAAYAKVTPIESVLDPKCDPDISITINGARSMYVGDIITLDTTVTGNVDSKALRWTTESSNIISVDAKGVIKAVGKGTATITATLIEGDNSYNNATIKITVSEIPTLLSLDSTSFDRCSDLKELYVNAINPKSIAIPGTGMKISADATIYVPKGSAAMYKAAWSTFAEQIKEVE